MHYAGKEKFCGTNAAAGCVSSLKHGHRYACLSETNGRSQPIRPSADHHRVQLHTYYNIRDRRMGAPLIS